LTRSSLPAASFKALFVIRENHLIRADWKRRLLLLAKICLAACLLAWLLASGKLELGRLTSISFDWRLLALFGIVSGSMIIPAFRWWWLLRIQGLHEPLGKVISLTWAGYLTALVLPGAAGGDIARSYLILRRRNHARARAFSTVLADRFLGLHSLFCLGSISAIWLFVYRGHEPGVQIMAALTLALLLAMTICLLALLYAPTRTLLFRVLPRGWRQAWDESFFLYRNNVSGLLGCFVLSLTSGILTMISFSVAGRLFGTGTPMTYSFLAGPLIVVANCLPITPGGIGLAEATSSRVFAGLGLPIGAEMMMLVRTVGFLISLPAVFAIASFNSPTRASNSAMQTPQFGRV
jgi:glycosyltransferase 2 family protein